MRKPAYTAPTGVGFDARFDHWLPNLINRNGATTMGRTVLFGSDAPLADPTAVDLVAHEVSHVPQWCWLGVTNPLRFLWYPVFFVLYWLAWLPGLVLGIWTQAPGNPFEWGPWKVGYRIEYIRAHRDAGHTMPPAELQELAAWERTATSLANARAKWRMQGRPA